jgi:GNAT superfamily N-acetyltransferase
MTVRRATVTDADELVRLRAFMIEAMGDDVDARPWREAAAAAFVRRIEDEPNAFAAFVVDGDEPGRLVSSGVGWVHEHLPGPRNPSGLRGHIASMSTEPSARRQGHGRAVFEALMAWFVDLGVTRVDLHATDEGARLYRAFGFTEGSHAALTWMAPEPSASR